MADSRRIADELVAEGVVFDAHVDSLQRALDLDHDLGVEGPGHLDLVRARRGGLGAVVLVSWVDPEHYLESSSARARALMDAGRRLARRHPDKLRLVGSGDELDRARADGRIAGVFGIEGGHALEESIERLNELFDEGLRVLTLVWNNHLSWIRSCMPADADVPEGLTDEGRAIVREMNRLGVLVDLSHAGVRSFFDTLDVSDRPAMASHSGCHALHAHPRNLTDEQLRALGAAGGVVGIPFHPGFLDEAARAEEMRVRKTAAYRDADGENPTATWLECSNVMRRYAAPLGLDRLVDHVVHAAELIGVEHVGLGSDFDGIERGPEKLEDASGYRNLIELLLTRGFSKDDVRAICGGNMRRVFARATGEGTRASEVGVLASASIDL